ncbi:MAG: hypothetical protein Sapg2KO_11000 [Saprospiraceae bacterium]
MIKNGCPINENPKQAKTKPNKTPNVKRRKGIVSTKRPIQGKLKAEAMVAVAYIELRAVLLKEKTRSSSGMYNEIKKVWPKLEKKVRTKPKPNKLR